MKIEFLFYIVVSAFLHALYNLYMRKSLGNRIFLTWMFIFSTIWGGIFLLAHGNKNSIPWEYLPFVFGAALFYWGYQVLVSQSYQRGDISRYYPLTVLSPMFIPIWATLFLGEHISILSGLGILVAVTGALTVKINAFTIKEVKKMFSFSSDYSGARFALGASVMYSFGAVLDKSKIAFFPLPVYLVILLLFMSIDGLIYSSFIEKEKLIPYFLLNWKSIIISGFIVFLSFITFREALRAVPVSLAVPIRQVAIIFAILLGIFRLKEKVRLGSIIGSAIIILGILLVNAGS